MKREGCVFYIEGRLSATIYHHFPAVGEKLHKRMNEGGRPVNLRTANKRGDTVGC